MDINITKKQLSVFRCIIAAYGTGTHVPEQGMWKALPNEALWLRHVEQVMVVGGVTSKFRLDKMPHLQQRISFAALQEISCDAILLKTIHEVLQSAGTRYVGAEIALSAKTKALVHNFKFIKDYPQHFTGLIRHLTKYKGDSAEWERVTFLMQHLKFSKKKSASDYLMGIGMNRNTLALDIRIQNIFRHMGVAFPGPELLARAKVYDHVEQQIIQKVCTPLGIEPVAFDRILFQNYRRIIRSDYLQLKLF
jgi:hypothetical protein